MKKLYVLSKDNGDGSHSVVATFDKDLIDEMKERYGQLKQYEDIWVETWCDVEGFHYQTWTVPDECTANTMGFYELKRENVFYL